MALLFIWIAGLTVFIFVEKRKRRELEKQIQLLKKTIVDLQKLHVFTTESMKDQKKSVEDQIPDQVDRKKPVAAKQPSITQPLPTKSIETKEKFESNEEVNQDSREMLEESEKGSKESKLSAVTQKQETKSRTRIDWEMLIGGRWLNRLGALAIVIGLIFFIKYAFDHQLISDQMKVILVTILGGLFLMGGRIFHRRELPVFAQGLIGTGIATLYIAVYAAHNVYHILDANIFIVLMSIVTILAIQQAIRYQSIAVSLLGWCGGYLTPFLAMVEEASTTGLYSYLALLSLGMIRVAIKQKNWSILYHLTLVATYLIFFVNQLIQPNDAEWLLRLCFLVVFWMTFQLYEVYYLLRKNQWLVAKEIAASVHALFFYGGLVWLLAPVEQGWITVSIVLAGAVYLLPIGILYWRKKLSQVARESIIRHGLTFCVLLAMAPLYYWTSYPLILIWIIEAAFLMWWATRKHVHWLVHYLLLFLFVITLTLFGFTIEQMIEQTPILPIANLQFLSYLGLTIVCVGGAVHKSQKNTIRHVLYIAGAVIFLIGFNPELLHCFDLIKQYTTTSVAELNYIYYLSLFASWGLYAWLLVWYGLRRRVTSLTNFSVGLFGFSVVGIMISGSHYQPIAAFGPIFNWRFGFLLGIAVVSYGFYRCFRKQGIKKVGFLFTSILVLFGLTNFEINDYFLTKLSIIDTFPTLDKTGVKSANLEFTHPLLLALSWVLFSLLLVWYGLRYQSKLMINSAWAVLGVGLLAVMVFGYAFSPIGLFTPVFNIRNMTLLITAAVIFIHLLWYKEQPKIQSICYTLITVLIFELISVEVNDVFRLLIVQDPQRVNELLNIKQLTFSIAWILYAVVLFGIGIWRNLSSIRWVAIGLIGVSTCKIFIYDLAFLDTLYRIFLFIGLGFILLLMSYIYQRYKHLFTSKKK